MARTPAYEKLEEQWGYGIEQKLRELAQRQAEPEAAAAELGVCISTLRNYVTRFGGDIVTERYIVMPALDTDLLEISHGDNDRLLVAADGVTTRRVGSAGR